MRRVLSLGFQRGIAFRQWRNIEGAAIHTRVPGSGVSGTVYAGHLALVPCTLVIDDSVELLPAGNLFLAVDEGEDCAGINFDVFVVGQFQHAQGMSDLLVTPLVSADDSNAERFNVRRLQQQQHSLLVGGCGAAGVLIENDFPFSLSQRKRSEDETTERDEKKSFHSVLPAPECRGARRGEGCKENRAGLHTV